MQILIAYERLILWVIILVYFLSWLPIMLGVIFNRDGWLPAGIRLSIAGIFIHSAWILIRWVEAGHGPYINLYEVASSDSIIAV